MITEMTTDNQTAKLLSSSGQRTTLLVPVDSAIMKMTRKPYVCLWDLS